MSNTIGKDVEMAALNERSTADGKTSETVISKERRNKTDKTEKKKASAGKSVSSCALYSACSISMVLVNKSLASSYNHLIDGNLNFLLVVFQAIVAVIAVELCKQLKWVEYPSFSMKTASRWAPVNILFCAMLFTGMASLQHSSVPMVTIFKNITNIIVSIGDYYFFGSTVESMIIIAFSMMLVGACLAATSDMTINMTGFFWMVANCAATAGYILYMKFATKTVKLSKFGMVFYNNVLCAVFLLPVTIYNGEINTFLKTESIHTMDYALKNTFAGFVGFFLNFASLNCVSHTGPTTYALVGSMNKIPITFLGYFLFDSVISGKTWIYISISMCGGFLYSFVKIASGRKVARPIK